MRRWGTKWFHTLAVHAKPSTYTALSERVMWNLFSPEILWLIHGSIWNGGLGKDTGKCRGSAPRPRVCAWFGRLLQPFKPPGRYFRIGSEWVSEKNLLWLWYEAVTVKHRTYCLYSFFFATLNKMQVLGMFLMHVYSRMWSHALMLSGHACFSVSWRLFAPVPLLHLHSTRIGLLTSSLTLSFSNLLFGFIFVPWDSSVTGCWCRLAAPPITNKLYNHNWNIIFIPT